MKKILIMLMMLMIIGSASAIYQLPNAYVNGALNVRNATALNATTATTVTATGIVQGEQLTSTDDARVADDATVNDLVVNATTDLNGAATTRGITLDADSNLVLSGTGTVTAPKFIGNINTPDYFSIGLGRIVDTNYTYSTGGKMDSIVMVDVRSYNSTITLLPAAQAPGNLTIVKLAYLPGAYFARINVTSGEHINGKDLVYTTDDASTFMPSISLWSSGAAWYVVNAYGTWSSADA